MTPRQSEALTFIRTFWAEHGYGPSYDEIADALGLKAKSGVVAYLRSLESKGYLVRHSNQARSVTPVEIAPGGIPVPEEEEPEQKEKVPWE